MSELGKQFAAALDRGTGPDDDLLFPFAHRFYAGRVHKQMTPQELHRMFSTRQVGA